MSRFRDAIISLLPGDHRLLKPKISETDLPHTVLPADISGLSSDTRMAFNGLSDMMSQLKNQTEIVHSLNNPVMVYSFPDYLRQNDSAYYGLYLKYFQTAAQNAGIYIATGARRTASSAVLSYENMNRTRGFALPCNVNGDLGCIERQIVTAGNVLIVEYSNTAFGISHLIGEWRYGEVFYTMSRAVAYIEYGARAAAAAAASDGVETYKQNIERMVISSLPDNISMNAIEHLILTGDAATYAILHDIFRQLFKNNTYITQDHYQRTEDDCLFGAAIAASRTGRLWMKTSLQACIPRWPDCPEGDVDADEAKIVDESSSIQEEKSEL